MLKININVLLLVCFTVLFIACDKQENNTLSSELIKEQKDMIIDKPDSQILSKAVDISFVSTEDNALEKVSSITYSIKQGEWKWFRWSAQQGVVYMPKIISVSGDPDLWIYSINSSKIFAGSANGGSQEDFVVFIATLSNSYYIGVYGYTDASFKLELRYYPISSNGLRLEMPIDNLPIYNGKVTNVWTTPYRDHQCGSCRPSFEGSGSHAGVDIAVKSGTSVKSIGNGLVICSFDSDTWGGLVVIKHEGVSGSYKGQPIYSYYAHLRKRLVTKGQYVNIAKVIGESGGHENDPNHGTSSGSHLHFGIDFDVSVDNDVFISPYWPSGGVNAEDRWINDVWKYTYNPIPFIEARN